MSRASRALAKKLVGEALLEEYLALNYQIERAEGRRAEIREMIRLRGGKVLSDALSGSLELRSRETVIPLKELTLALPEATLRKLGLIRTVEYEVLVIMKRRKRR